MDLSKSYKSWVSWYINRSSSIPKVTYLFPFFLFEGGPWIICYMPTILLKLYEEGFIILALNLLLIEAPIHFTTLLINFWFNGEGYNQNMQLGNLFTNFNTSFPSLILQDKVLQMGGLVRTLTS